MHDRTCDLFCTVGDHQASSLTIVVAHHMYSMPPYPYLAIDYGTQLSLFTHHMWIGGFLIVSAAAHAAIFMVRDYDPTIQYNDLQQMGTCTRNRHRWIGREYLEARDHSL
ncbi:Photosystem I P700 chlorophyll a apoprotein A1 [Glycine max]|nr:Photosystem I P700 chlorophyll a apoprotein A1 [Glycine max]